MTTTKERILGESLDLASRTGLAGVTLGVLAQQAGMSKSGLFAHFGSKEDVQLRLLEESTRVANATFLNNAMSKPAGLARLKAVFEGWIGWTQKAGLAGGCPIAAGMFELDDVEVSDPVRQRLLTMEKTWRDLLERLVSDAVASGELEANLDPEQFAWEMCGIYLVHHTSQRFLRDPRARKRAMMAFNGLVSRSSAAPLKPARQSSRKRGVAAKEAPR